MSKPYLTEQERIDKATLQIDDPTRIVGSGYIQFPPQVPFSQPLTRQPPTLTGAQTPHESSRNGDARAQRQRQPTGGHGQGGGYHRGQGHSQGHSQQSQQRPQARPNAYAQRPRASQQPPQASLSSRPAQQNGAHHAAPPRSNAAPSRQRAGAQRAPAASSAAQPVQQARPQADYYANGKIAPQASSSNSRPLPAVAAAPQDNGPPGLEAATARLSLEEKAGKAEPLSKAQAKRLRKKLREGRAEV